MEKWQFWLLLWSLWMTAPKCDVLTIKLGGYKIYVITFIMIFYTSYKLASS